MEMIFKNYRLNDELISFKIKDKKINGICGNSKEELMNIIYLKSSYEGKIIIDKEELNKYNFQNIKKKTIVIYNNPSFWCANYTIYEIMYYEIRLKKLKLKNPQKKITDSLKIVGLNELFLEKRLNTLSKSEQKKIQIAISLLSNPNLIILEEPFKYLDKKNEKQLIMLLQKIKDHYNKTIVIISDDTNKLFQYTDYTIITKNNKIIIEGKTNEVFKKVELLKSNRISIPEIVDFTYKAKNNKNAKIDYHKDIRDIIKDIYKHV